MIYAVGVDSDQTFLYFLAEATKRGIEIQPINLRAVILVGDWRIAMPDDGRSFVTVSEQKIELDASAAYFCRLIDLASMQPDLLSAMRWRNLLAALAAWLEHIPGTVINRPGSYCDNGCKPLHEHSLQRYGFNVPSSLTSSDPARLVAFASEAPTIVKAVSGVRANSRLVEAEALRDFHPLQGPIHLQRYVAGADIRAHVVDTSVYAELIRAHDVDYRSSDQELEFSPWTLPTSLTELLVSATAAFGLTFAGWDFKLSEDGQYWCLEANPMPGYNGYDRRLGGQITEALLNHLCL